MRLNLEDMTPSEQARFLQEVATISGWLADLCQDMSLEYEIYQPNVGVSIPGNMPKVRVELMSHQLHAIHILWEQDRKLAAVCRNTQTAWPDGVQEALEFWRRIKFRLGQLDMDYEGLIDHLDTMVEANEEGRVAKPADPELERLLAEEEEIERMTREQPEGGRRIDSL